MDALRDFGAGSQVTTHADIPEDPLHRHKAAYAAIVSRGAYLELSADGAVAVEAGDIVIHPPFHRHRNFFTRPDTSVLNIPLPFSAAQKTGYRVMKGAGNSAFRRFAAGDPAAAATEILNRARHAGKAGAGLEGRASELADLLRCQAETAIADLSRRLGLSHGHLTRTFKDIFGTPPSEFRSEIRFRRALSAVLSSASLSDAAHMSGYADQAHMTRDFRRRAGISPGALRQDIKFVQASL